MNTESREHISSLMDGEVSRETGRFLVRRLGADEELCATWARYHLVRDCLRHQEGGMAKHDFAGRIRRSLEDVAPASPSRIWSAKWLRPAAGLAVAASVALMAIVAVGPGGRTASTSVGELAEDVGVQPFTSPQGLAGPPASQQASLLGDSSGNTRMNAYLLRHYQATGASGVKGFITFVPIVVRPASSGQESSDTAAASSQKSNGDESARPQ